MKRLPYIKSYFTLVFLISSILLGFSQNATYTFDNCTLVDESGNLPPATTIFTPDCDCGLEEDGLYFNGSDDHLIFPAELDSLMETDFSISFYFRFDQVTTVTDLFSVRSNCALDSFLAISYNPSNNEVSLEIAPSIGNIETQTSLLDQSLCWHRVVLTKAATTYSLYLDDLLAISILSSGVVEFPNPARATFTNSPCIAVNLDRFNGWMDEFLFYDRALSGSEVTNTSLRPDQILTNDTTIVAGATVDLLVGSTCASSFNWTPSADLDDQSILNPTATPMLSTDIALTIVNDGNCTTIDSIRINVIDPNAVDCSALLLPNAFTPNNDQLNDLFGISSIFLIDELEYFDIYDRWGGKLWSTTDKAEKWDATFKNQQVNPGMYLYKVKYTCGGEEFLKVDNFSVLR